MFLVLRFSVCGIVHFAYAFAFCTIFLFFIFRFSFIFEFCFSFALYFDFTFDFMLPSRFLWGLVVMQASHRVVVALSYCGCNRIFVFIFFCALMYR